MKRKLCLALTLLMPLSNAIAVEWTSIIKDSQHEVFVDIDSYNVDNNLPFLIAKTVYQTPQPFAQLNKKTPYSISIAKFQFNCVKPLYRIRTIQLMDKKNTVLDSLKTNSQFQALKPNTDEFSIGQLTCQVHQMLGGAHL